MQRPAQVLEEARAGEAAALLAVEPAREPDLLKAELVQPDELTDYSMFSPSLDGFFKYNFDDRMTKIGK